jgi:3-deoxy-manno-octulosonate cytidylyltransferase (CMP-KDO synthetase)
MSIKVLCVIPSRINSTRLPRKPLLLIQGKPMIQWTYENALRCPLLSELVVATDSQEIADIVNNLGGKVIISDEPFLTGSDRVAAVARCYPTMDVVINLQGDEPFVQPSMLTALLAPYLAGHTPDMTTLATQLLPEEYNDPGIVKIVSNLQQYALYFSRANIPYQRQTSSAPLYHHFGMYAFRSDFLQTYAALAPTPLELTEQLEQLRALEHGYQIKLCPVTSRTIEINTPEDYAKAQHFNYTAE